ncbi:hypothetical protein M422DRAFT_31587 [Sphaerobolus stellatus SS14]|uniref:Uncharacterized protein n=1 Tax=Sphaerobolus stellatus (strain SS14) TaxID=990650 RepID=A0A0C9V555_SPHS4|nr:hypothetical protein M422DRAFT_31587 [Sphaerobolus stellatus SS14]
MDNDWNRLWQLISELSQQLEQNRQKTASLQAQAGSVNSAASHQGNGFALRRFNMHLSQAAFESELERFNASFIQQNAELQNENKQLAALLKEYEQTLETVMTKFRTHAHDAQQHELALARHYESLLIPRETSLMASDLAASTAYSEALGRMSDMLRKALRAAGGESTDTEAPIGEYHPYNDEGGYIDGIEQADYALERETELARLEFENQELRKLAGLEPITPNPHSSSSIPMRWDPDPAEGGQPHGGQRVPSSQLNLDAAEEMMMRQQGIIPGQTQIVLDGAPPHPSQQGIQSHAPTAPLHVAFPPDAPLVTRKYGRRSGSGSGNFIGGPSNFANDPNRNPPANMTGTLRPGSWGINSPAERLSGSDRDALAQLSELSRAMVNQQMQLATSYSDFKMGWFNGNMPQ